MLTCGLLRTNFSFDTAVSLGYVAEPSARIELATPSLPRKCTATVLRGRSDFLMRDALACFVCASQRTGAFFWQSGRRDSNPRQPAWKAGALPTELHPRTREPANTYEHCDAPLAISSPVLMLVDGRGFEPR